MIDKNVLYIKVNIKHGCIILYKKRSKLFNGASFFKEKDNFFDKIMKIFD
jgi:hypothetical protein